MGEGEKTSLVLLKAGSSRAESGQVTAGYNW